MSELLSIKRCVAAATASFLLTGCTTVEARPPGADFYQEYQAEANVPVPLKRCFDTPQPVEPAHNVLPQGSAITVDRTPEGTVAGDPGDPALPIQEKLRESTVKIINLLSVGSGVLVETPEGPVVLTAAHVVYQPLAKSMSAQDMGTLTVVGSNHEYGNVIGGCYMYESNGVFDSLDSGRPNQIDIAVLRLARPIGEDALTLATTEEQRGSWNVWFSNYQGDRPWNDPASYGGMVLTDPNYTRALRILTGVQSYRDCAQYRDGYRLTSACALQPGASGGLVATRDTGELLGISVFGQMSREYDCMKSDLLNDLYNVQLGFEGCPTDTVWPVVAGVVPLQYLRLALSSPVYRQTFEPPAQPAAMPPDRPM